MQESDTVILPHGGGVPRERFPPAPTVGPVTDPLPLVHEAGPADVPGVHRVCRMTARAGADATADHADPDLPGLVWAGPYLAAPGAVALVVRDDHGVAGYCLAVPDTAAFERWLRAAWLPALRERHPRGSGATPADAALVEALHTGPTPRGVDPARYPAHLHVDLLPRLQGRGAGRLLVEEACRRLATAGARGVWLGVDPANARALAFYRHLGFTDLGDDGHGPLLGRDLRT